MIGTSARALDDDGLWIPCEIAGVTRLSYRVTLRTAGRFRGMIRASGSKVLLRQHRVVLNGEAALLQDKLGRQWTRREGRNLYRSSNHPMAHWTDPAWLDLEQDPEAERMLAALEAL